MMVRVSMAQNDMNSVIMIIGICRASYIVSLLFVPHAVCKPDDTDWRKKNN